MRKHPLQGTGNQIIAGMLEQIRRNRRLGTTVLMLCVVLWLVALWAGVRVRAMPGGPAPVVTTAPASPAKVLGASHVHGAHGGQSTNDSHDSHRAVAPDGGPAPEPAHAHSDHGHHGPDCVLCIALSPPATVAVLVYRPPVPRQGLRWHAPARHPPSRLAAAPLPARGPPAPLHA